LRKALVKPIFKGKGKKSLDPSSYRGIALSSAVAKTFESIIDTRLSIFTGENDTCMHAQFGSKLDHNAIDVICTLLISHIKAQKATDKILYCAMFDFERAYPLVSRL